MNINSTNYSPIIRPLPGSLVPNRLSGELGSARNESVFFDCLSDIRRTLVPMLKNIVRFCQALSNELVTLVSCQENAKKGTSELDISNTGLMTKKLQTANVLRYVDQLVKETNIGWYEINQDNHERLCDQEARRNFNRMVLTIVLEGLSFEACTRMTEHLEGEHGQHLRGVLDFAAEQVGQAEEDPLKVSTVYNYSIFIEDLIITLHERLGHYDVRVEPGINIQRYSELTSLDIKTLSGVGISVETLTANSY